MKLTQIALSTSLAFGIPAGLWHGNGHAQWLPQTLSAPGNARNFPEAERPTAFDVREKYQIVIAMAMTSDGLPIVTNDSARYAKTDTLGPKDSHRIVTVESKEMKDGPLSMKWLVRQWNEYLGHNQYEHVLEVTNGIQPKTGKNGKTYHDLGLDAYASLKVPMVFPKLARTFPENVADIPEKFPYLEREFRKDPANADRVIVTKLADTGKYALAYYRNGKLFVATHVSPGTPGHETSQGYFKTDYKVSRKRSSLYEDAPMPYAVHFHEHLFLHHGRVNGTPLSHGCVRVPGVYMREIFENAGAGIPVIVRFWEERTKSKK